MQTMTIKELAEVAGCNQKTVRVTIKKHYPDLVKNGRATRLTKEECFDIMNFLPKKNDLGKPRTQNGKVVQGAEDIAKIVSMAVIETLKAMGQIPKEKPALPELPPVNYRLELNALVRAYASKNNMIHQFAWSKFYERCLYRLRVNIPVCASNAGMDNLDWAEENGMVESMYVLAKEEF